MTDDNKTIEPAGLMKTEQAVSDHFGERFTNSDDLRQQAGSVLAGRKG